MVIAENYEYSWYRSKKCKHCNEWIPIFAFGHHMPKEQGEDDFTKKEFFFYQWGGEDYLQYFLKRMQALYGERFFGDISFDYICVMPKSSKGVYNPNMEALAKLFGEKTRIRFERVLLRNRDVKQQHEIETAIERMKNVEGSITVNMDVKGKNILVLDNTTSTGANVNVAYDALKMAGAKMVIFICLALSGHFGKEEDFDLNPAMKKKAKEIIATFHSPRISKEKRIKTGKQVN